MRTRTRINRDSLIYITLGFLNIYLLNKEFRGIIEGSLFQLSLAFGFLYFLVRLIISIVHRIKKGQKIKFGSMITLFAVGIIVWSFTYINNDERFKSQPILKSRSLSNHGAISEQFILRQNNSFDMVRYDLMRGNTFVNGKYSLSGDTIILHDKCLKHYDNKKKEYYYFDKYFIDSLDMQIIPIKDNHLVQEQFFMFGIDD